MNDFLPKNYEVPASKGNYMKLADGENTIRILSSAIVGWEYWSSDRKPHRLKFYPDDTPEDIKIEGGVPSKIKPFWAFVVWNYATKSVQILELTQKSIMTTIKSYVDNKKWGDPKGYDFSITRTGEGLDTEYVTIAEPHSPVPEEAQREYTSKTIMLEELFSNGDPFNAKTSDGNSMPKF